MKKFSRSIASLLAVGVAATVMLAVPGSVSASPAHSHSDDESYVTALYTDYLGRGAGPSEIEYWADKLSAGAPVTVVSDGFVTSDEYRMIRITEAYAYVLGRGVDAPGALNWLNAMRSGQITTDDIERSLYQSDEFYQIAARRNSAPPNDGALVDALWPYILGREVSGFEGFDLLNAGFGRDRTFFVSYVYFSQEAANARVRTMYQRYFGRLPDDSGLAVWANVDLRIGDTATRSGLTSSEEYFQRADSRFPL